MASSAAAVSPPARMKSPQRANAPGAPMSGFWRAETPAPAPGAADPPARERSPRSRQRAASVARAGHGAALRPAPSVSAPKMACSNSLRPEPRNPAIPSIFAGADLEGARRQASRALESDDVHNPVARPLRLRPPATGGRAAGGRRSPAASSRLIEHDRGRINTAAPSRNTVTSSVRANTSSRSG